LLLFKNQPKYNKMRAIFDEIKYIILILLAIAIVGYLSFSTLKSKKNIEQLTSVELVKFATPKENPTINIEYPINLQPIARLEDRYNKIKALEILFREDLPEGFYLPLAVTKDNHCIQAVYKFIYRENIKEEDKTKLKKAVITNIDNYNYYLTCYKALSEKEGFITYFLEQLKLGNTLVDCYVYNKQYYCVTPVPLEVCKHFGKPMPLRFCTSFLYAINTEVYYDTQYHIDSSDGTRVENKDIQNAFSSWIGSLGLEGRLNDYKKTIDYCSGKDCDIFTAITNYENQKRRDFFESLANSLESAIKDYFDCGSGFKTGSNSKLYNLANEINNLLGCKIIEDNIVDTIDTPVRCLSSDKRLSDVLNDFCLNKDDLKSNDNINNFKKNYNCYVKAINTLLHNIAILRDNAIHVNNFYTLKIDCIRKIKECAEKKNLDFNTLLSRVKDAIVNQKKVYCDIGNLFNNGKPLDTIEERYLHIQNSGEAIIDKSNKIETGDVCVIDLETCEARLAQ